MLFDNSLSFVKFFVVVLFLQVLTVIVISVALNIPRFFKVDLVEVTNNANETVVTLNRSAFGQNAHFEVFTVRYVCCVS
jgi:cell division septal protein FtsQ